MSATVLLSSASTSAEASTPSNGTSTSLKTRPGWASSATDNERNVKRQYSEPSGSVLKRQRTPSSSSTTNNEGMLTRSVRHSLSTENQELLENMSENDFVPQRNLAVASDESPGETDVKVELLVLKNDRNFVLVISCCNRVVFIFIYSFIYLFKKVNYL